MVDMFSRKSRGAEGEEYFPWKLKCPFYVSGSLSVPAKINLGIISQQHFRLYSILNQIFFSAPEIVEKNALQLVVAAEQASQEVTEEDDEEEEEEVDDDEEVSV